jgi:putative ABC transport system permease protein
MKTTLFDTLGQDLRYGVRLLRQSPGFALVAVLSLGLGVGANSAIFQLLNAVRLRSLPVTHPEQLVEVKIGETKGGRTGSFRGRNVQLTEPLWQELRRDPRPFSAMLAWGVGSFNLATGGEARYVDGMWVSGGFFDTLGVRPLVGRVFTEADDRPGCGGPGAVLGYAFWQREYGGSPSAIGRTLQLEGHPFEIVGVTPPSFFGIEVGRSFDVAIPLCSEAIIRGANSAIGHRDAWWLGVMGRLKPGATAAEADAWLRSISAGIFEATLPPAYAPDDVKNYLAFKLGAFPGGSGVSSLRRQYETPLWLLLAIAGVVLLIACANLANLLLARASARERELAVRFALGASRGRVVRQLLVESMLLAALGAGLGAWVARAASRALVAFLSTESDRVFVDLGTDWRVLAFTAAVAVAACLLFGLAPALRATRTQPATVLRASGRGLTEPRGRFGLRRGLVVVQVALSLVLVVGAFLFVSSFRNLMTLDAGFRRSGLLVTQLDVRGVKPPAEGSVALFREALEQVRAVPGVRSAALTFIVPVSGSGWNENVLADGLSRGTPKTVVNFDRVSAGFFETMGTPLVAGRDFDDHDVMSAPRVAIVNETFVKKVLQGQDPLGRTFALEPHPGEPQKKYEIVGLVKDMKYSELREDFTPIAYLPVSQDDDPLPFQAVIVRADGSLASLLPSITRAVGAVSPRIAINFRPFETQVRESLLRERLMATLSGFFGGLAGLLATLGLYGVMSYTVSRRQGEIGIRMALGADRSRVMRLVMGEAGTLLLAGLAIGTLLALAAARTAGSLLFGLPAWDPVTLVTAAGVLAAVAAAASYVPAWRASRLAPTIALRQE